MSLLSDLRVRFHRALAGLVPEPVVWTEHLRPASDPRFGDYQASFAMPLARQLGKPPREVAAEVIARLDLGEEFETPEIAGAGFINLRLRPQALVERTSALFRDARLGVAQAGAARRTYVIDYSGPNVAKPMHVGHLRSTVIGDALCRILRFLGHTVVADNHVGDWGTQFGLILFGYKHFLDPDAYARDRVQELARLYRLVHQLESYHETRAELPRLDRALAEKLAAVEAAGASPAEGDPKAAAAARKKLLQEVEELRAAIAAGRKKLSAVESDSALAAAAAAHPDVAVRARQETARLHAGDPENTRLWNEFVPACLEAIRKVYQRLDVQFDHWLGESWYQPRLADVVDELQRKGLARESDGAVCVFVPGNEAPFIIRKRDGAFTYGTTDLATVQHRLQEFRADAILYVVDTRQSEHFKLLFETCRMWGCTQVELKHVNFGTVLGPDGRPYKTREGDAVGLESLLDEAVAQARTIVEANAEEIDLPPEQFDVVAENIGIGGIKYADLRHNRESDYQFLWDKMLSKRGDTATYMQYAVARVAGIFRKGNVDRAEVRKNPPAIQLDEPAERALALQLLRFAEAVDAVVVDYRPHLLCEYLFQTANAFSRFFDDCPVLKAPSEELRRSRLALTDLTGRVLQQGLELLGIRVHERM